jgi:REP element-mobilizing transposase RayT
LRNPATRQHVVESLQHFDGSQYDLLSSVIMPNHVHILVKPVATELSVITQAWKSCSARKINRNHNSTGTVWIRESFNRIVRSEANLASYVCYILNNPIKANLPNTDFTLLKPPT